jgi:hypothetical protein
MEITEILKKYDTDKELFHHYGVVYEELFKRFKRRDKLNILEVGTQKGGSLLAWKEYFPNANVFGVDIVDVVPEEYRKDTVTRVIADIKDVKFDLNFDIIIDDGSHYLGDIVYVISQYIVKLRKSGMIIIEDVREPNLLYKVIANLLDDLKIVYPNLKGKNIFKGHHFDCSTPESPGSFIIAITME